MQPVSIPELKVLVGLSSEFLPEGSFENLLSGHFTVLGKVTRILEGEDKISLYQRTSSSYLMTNSAFNFAEALRPLQQAFGIGAVSSDEIEAPALQLLPLAIFV